MNKQNESSLSNNPIIASDLTDEERARAVEILLEEKRRQATLVVMQQEIAHTYHDIDTIMQIILERCQEMTRAQGCVFEIAEEDEMVYRAVSSSAAKHLGLRLKKDGSLSGQCVKQNAVLICEDTETDPRVDKIACRAIGARSMIVAPLQHDGQAIGALKVFAAEKSAFTAWDVTTLQLLSGMMSVVLRDAASLASLQESENRFRSLVDNLSLIDNLPLIIWISDTTGKVTFVNHYWSEFIGCPIDEIYSPKSGEGIHPDDHDTLLESWVQTAAVYLPYHSEFRRLYRDGQYHWMSAYAFPRFHADGKFLGYIGFSIDINKEKVLQSQLLDAQKMESLGRLAGGVAHDFNNLLTAILGYTQLASSSLPPDAEQHCFLNNVITASERAAELTKQLLMYARRQMVEFRNIDLNKVVRDVLPILQQTIGEQFELVTELTADECYAYTNAGQIEQVLINLVVNARDAMPDGGHILLETACVTLDEDYIATHFDAVPGEYVMLSVSDTGMGMTHEVSGRIFEPFFTTKEIGKGTGLGLATCYGIIKQSKGNIWVYSELGQGATFKVYLPVVLNVSTQSNTLPQESPMPRVATLLLVDDEPMIRDVAGRILREKGYQVLEARNGADALQIQSEWNDEIDLLITDVVMPLMGGRELEERIQRLRPHMKTLYMSGYTQNVIVREGVLKSNIMLLTKPFTSVSLLQKVYEALEAQ